MQKSRLYKNVLYHFFVIIFGLFMIYPVLWMFFASFKDNHDIYSLTAPLIPSTFKFTNYVTGWNGFGTVNFGDFIKNSFVISIVSTAGAVASSALVAYGLARIKFAGKKFWFAVMLISMMLPFQILMVPQFILFHKLGWVNTFLPLIVPQFFGQPFFIFLMLQFIQGIPSELDQSAKIDGCNRFSIFLRIILPLMTPAIITSAIFSFCWRWDDFFAALLYLNKPKIYTVPLALRMFSDPAGSSDWGAMMAMGTLSLVPLVLIFVFFQKYLVEGISTTGLKG